jgi:hypothetical protein
MWQTPFNGIFTNEWFSWAASNYSQFWLFAPGVVISILKIIAVLVPSVESNKIVDLIQGFFKPKEG